MPQVSVTVNGRTFRLECNDGEEQHLLTLAGEMSRHVDTLRARFGQVGDERLLLMAGLTIADELAETRAKLEDATAALAEVRNDAASADALVEATQTQLAGRITAAAERIESLNAAIGAAHSGRDGD